MKTLILVWVLLISTQISAQAQYFEGEGRTPSLTPHAEEITSIADYRRIVNEAKTSGKLLVVEFYLPGCGWYNGSVGTVNQVMRDYGNKIKVIEIPFGSEAGRLATSNASPQFHFLARGEETFHQEGMGSLRSFEAQIEKHGNLQTENRAEDSASTSALTDDTEDQDADGSSLSRRDSDSTRRNLGRNPVISSGAGCIRATTHSKNN